MQHEKEVLLVWLHWPEKCFSLTDMNLHFLRKYVGEDVEILTCKKEADFLFKLRRATKVITWEFKAEWYKKAPCLKLVATPSAGHELIAPPPTDKIKVHFGHYHGGIIAESVAAFILGWSRGFFRPEREDFWPRVELSDKCEVVEGTRAVILGYGNVGRAIGEKLERLGVFVTGITRSNKKEIPDAIHRADWIICALPGDTGTYNIVNADFLRQLRPWAVLINVGRGNAVDEKALLRSLRRGYLAGAYLDVFRGEPSPFSQEAPVIYGREYNHLPWNLIRMPHASAFCSSYLVRAFKELKDDGLI